jgi:RHS repeat-associated protein
LYDPEFGAPAGRQTSGGVVSWYGTDLQGSVRLVFDNSGTATATITYSAWGSITSGTLPDRFGYAMLQRDSVTGLSSGGNGTRETDNGKWYQEDPLGLSPDVNPRRYVGNSPTNYVDPSGLDDKPGDYVRFPQPGLYIPRQDVPRWNYIAGNGITITPVASGHGAGMYHIQVTQSIRNTASHAQIVDRLREILRSAGQDDEQLIRDTLSVLYLGGIDVANPNWPRAGVRTLELPWIHTTPGDQYGVTPPRYSLMSGQLHEGVGIPFNWDRFTGNVPPRPQPYMPTMSAPSASQQAFSDRLRAEEQAVRDREATAAFVQRSLSQANPAYSPNWELINRVDDSYRAEERERYFRLSPAERGLDDLSHRALQAGLFLPFEEFLWLRLFPGPVTDFGPRSIGQRTGRPLTQSPDMSGLYGVGAKPYGPRRLEQLGKYLDKRGVDLVIDEAMKGGVFSVPRVGRPQFIVGPNVGTETVWHELGHFIHWRRVGGSDAYRALPRVPGNNVPEQFVFDLLQQPSRWERLSPKYRVDSECYITDEWPRGWEGMGR